MSSSPSRTPESTSSGTPEPTSGLFQGIRQGRTLRAQERWQRQVDKQEQAKRKEARIRMLDAFKAFCIQQHGIDIDKVRLLDEPAVTHAMHDFVHAAVQRRNETNGGKGTVETLESKRVSAIIDKHYNQFKLTRDTATGEKLPAELTEIDAQQRKTRMKEYRHQESPFGEEAIKDGAFRFERFPEIGIAMELRDVLVDHADPIVKDSSEVLLSAYGTVFPSVNEGGRIAIINTAGEINRMLEAGPPPKH